MPGRKKLEFLIFITFLESLEQEEYRAQKKRKSMLGSPFLP